MNDTPTECKLIGRVAEVEFSAPTVEAFLRAVCIAPVKKLSFSYLDVHWKGEGC